MLDDDFSIHLVDILSMKRERLKISPPLLFYLKIPTTTPLPTIGKRNRGLFQRNNQIATRRNFVVTSSTRASIKHSAM